jgi:hypothetical protein
LVHANSIPLSLANNLPFMQASALYHIALEDHRFTSAGCVTSGRKSNVLQKGLREEVDSASGHFWLGISASGKSLKMRPNMKAAQDCRTTTLARLQKRIQ